MDKSARHFRHYTKEEIQRANKRINDAQLQSGILKLKRQCLYTQKHVQQNFKIPSVGKNMKQQNSHTQLVRKEMDTTTLKTPFGIFKAVKDIYIHTHPMAQQFYS